jgi:hypothetical protein
MAIRVNPGNARAAVLGEAHIQRAFAAILHGDVAARETWKHRLTTLLAILGPGLIVKVGDNDAAPSPPTARRAGTTAPRCSGPWRC